MIMMMIDYVTLSFFLVSSNVRRIIDNCWYIRGFLYVTGFNRQPSFRSQPSDRSIFRRISSRTQLAQLPVISAPAEKYGDIRFDCFAVQLRVKEKH